LGGRRLEGPDELVLERGVYAARAGVAPAARATALLVVDASRLVALGAEHVQAAELADLVALLLDALLGRVEDLVPRRLALLGVLLGVEAARLHLLYGEELGVAAEHDVGAATGHVRGDRHGSLATGER